MDFGSIYRAAFSSPKPDYEFTRAKFVWTINTYIASCLANNVGKPHLAVEGQVEYPPASPVPYVVPPDSGPLCGALAAFTPGIVTEKEYDQVAENSRGEIGSFWPNFFKLIGRGISRSGMIIQPLITDPLQPGVPQFSTPMLYTNETMSVNGSFYLTKGNLYTVKQFLDDWQIYGEKFRDEILSMNIQDIDTLASNLGRAVKKTANETGIFWRHYQGTVKPAYMLTPGILEGWIVGSIKYD